MRDQVLQLQKINSELQGSHGVGGRQGEGSQLPPLVKSTKDSLELNTRKLHYVTKIMASMAQSKAEDDCELGRLGVKLEFLRQTGAQELSVEDRIEATEIRGFIKDIRCRIQE